MHVYIHNDILLLLLMTVTISGFDGISKASSMRCPHSINRRQLSIDSAVPLAYQHISRKILLLHLVSHLLLFYIFLSGVIIDIFITIIND